MTTPAQPPSPPPGDGPVRGRDGALARLSAGVAALAAGTGGTWIVEGREGLGASRLLHAVADDARRRGVRVLAGDAAAGGDPVRAALLGGPAPVTGPDGTPDVVALLTALQGAVGRAAAAGPVLVVLDDLHRADAAALLALRVLVPRLAARPVGWLVAVRTDAAGTDVRDVVERLRDQGAEPLHLAPLEPAAVAAVVADVLGPDPGPALLGLADAAGGRPRDLLALLAGLAEEDATTRRDGVLVPRTPDVAPARFAALLQARAAALPPEARRLLRAAGLLGDEVGFAPLAALLGVPASALVQPLRAAIAARLLDGDGHDLRLPHPLVGAALRAGLTAADRAELRDLALAAVPPDGVPTPALAGVVAAAAEPPDARAAALLRRAAEALASRDPARAAALSRRALELTPGDAADRSGLVAATVDLLRDAGDLARARALAAAALARDVDAADQARVRLALARLVAATSFADAARDSAAAAAGAGVPAGVRAQLLAAQALAEVMAGDAAAAEATASRARELAAHADEPTAATTALTVLSMAAFDRTDWDRALALVEEALAVTQRAGGAEHDLWAPPTSWRALLRSACGRTDEAVRDADRGIGLARGRGQSAAVRLWHGTRARVLLDAGRLAEARDEADAGLALVRPGEQADLAELTVGFVRCRVGLLTGDGSTRHITRARAARMLAAEPPSVRSAGAWLAVLLADAEGDRATVRRQAPALAAAVDGSGPAMAAPLDVADVPLLVRAALDAGADVAAASAVRAVVRRAALAPAYPVLTAAALHARALLAGDPVLLAEAVERFALVPRPLPRAAAHEHLGRLLAASDPGGAARHLEAALALLRPTGAAAPIRRIEDALRALGGTPAGPAPTAGPTGWAALSPAERRVAEAAADGGTNRELGERLHLSGNTVATHLRRAYAKLGVASRVELVRVVRERHAAESDDA
ncbi:helix-turn-helix transcriptional regulator [Patulibacter sp. SYSU D01012]|uniref:helix-turn-helix transcriptional regulator n=1 Tax=Patulibacter sp. SYSU D01012 TaxID=2817381 RepID=UPI001B312051